MGVGQEHTDPSGGELAEPTVTVWPCAVTLYCGYAYESALVAESFQTAVPAALAFAAGTLLLALFRRRSAPPSDRQGQSREPSAQNKA